MTDALSIDGRTVFRIVTDYEGICDALSDRVEDLQATRLGVDEAGGLALGHSSTLLCKPQIKGYGPESLTKMLKATGMALVFVIDDERFAAVKERLGRRERPVRPIARTVAPRWLFRGKKACEMGKKRWSNVPEEKRKRMMKKLAKAAWIKRRRAARKSAHLEAAE